MYVELVENSIKNRGKIVPLSDVKKQPFEYERYISLFPFTQDVQEYVKTHGSIRGYKGRHYCPVVMIDIDNEDLETARQETIKLIQHLVGQYKIQTESLRIYFSGNKGFHLGITIKDLQPSEDIAERCKKFVNKISNVEVDNAIYEPHRLIRMPNSKNKKSGLFKIPLTWDELNKEISEILKLAEQPKELSFKNVPNDFKVIFESIEITEPVKEGTELFSVPEKGDRNNLLFKSACRLFNTGLKTREVYKLIGSLNSNSKDSLSESELLTLIGSAEQKTGTKQVKGFKSFGYYVPEWYELTKPEHNVIHLGFPKLDKEMKGKLRGKLCVIMHYGGTRKSLLAQNIAYFNIQNFQQRIAYSSMEMGVKDLADRFIDMIVDDSDYNAHYEIELKEKVNTGSALKIVEDYIAPKYNENLYISFSASMDCPKYRDTLIEMSDSGKPADIFIVDGLNMMQGSTTEDIDKHTQGLKEIAKEFNVFVLLIAHVSRGLHKDTRDVSSQARGSEKIIDNCDFYICPSLLRANDIEEDYVRDKGYIRLVNKRGTGNIVNLIYDLDCKRLLMSESDMSVKDFEQQDKEAF